MPDCASALDALRKAEDTYRSTLNELASAQAAVIPADQRLAKAEKAYNDAALAADKAQKDWSDFVNGLINDPSLGVAGIEAGAALSAKDVPSGATSALVRGPDGVAHILWGRSDQPAVKDAWNAAALKAIGTNNNFAADGKVTADAVPPAKAELDSARDASKAAHARLDAAQKANQDAQAAYEGAVQAARAACGSDPKMQPTSNGSEFGVDPLVSPGQRDKAVKTINLLRPAEVAGMKIVQHYDHPGPKDAFAVWNQDGDNKVHLYDSAARAAIIKHEVGHWVYHNKLSDQDRKNWKDSWGANKAKMPTSIAKDDEDQGFAECYEKIRDNEPLDPAIKAAINKILEKIH
jgi:hypothetical protein